VRRTIKWAKRSKAEYLRLIHLKNLTGEERPLIFAVIQGGAIYKLRKWCAEELLEIGFDGFGYGGWPLDKEGNLLEDILNHTREMIPTNYPMHALGIAHPANIIKCANMGYDLFDGALPTRDARHGRLYCFTTFDKSSIPSLDRFNYMYILDDRYIKSKSPISPFCDCLTCANYSIGYVHHLFKINDGLAFRLATIHNLRFITQVTELMRKNRHA
jgi:queuine tRNA-ribosyltransferase